MASRTHVAHMQHGDFYHGEKSMTLDKAREVKMELDTKSGETIVLKPKVTLDAGDIIDSMFMSKKALCDFYEEQMEDAYKTGVMFSLHVKATMMKVSHPIVFGHAVKVFYKDAFAKHGKLFDELGVNVNNGLSDLYDKIETLPASQRDEIIHDLHACHEHRPELAMVDSASGITNFHSPNDVIVDASMPAMIRAGGKMYGADGHPKDTKAVNPESTFSRIYQEIINFCKTNGQFDPTTMGTVPNVGLMAQQAEEYGSHDKTFEIPEDGVANIVDVDTGEVLLTQNVEDGDIWRMPVVKDAPIRDWVKLAVTRARDSGMPVVFWLDSERPHENELRKKVLTLPEGPRHRGPRHPDHVAGARHAVHDRARSARPGHHRRDRQHPARLPHRPVPDPGAGHQREDAVDRAADGGRRPVRDRRRRLGAQARQQLVEENHLRWDSLGEFLALAAAWKTWASRPATSGPSSWPRRSTPRPESCWTTTRTRRARPASSTTAAASSISRCTGRRNSPSRPRTRSWQTTSRRWPRRWPRTKTPSSPNSTRCRAIRWTSAATTTRTGKRPRR